MQGTNRSGEGGRRACYVTPDLSYYEEGERKIRAKIINGMGKKNKQMKIAGYSRYRYAIPQPVDRPVGIFNRL